VDKKGISQIESIGLGFFVLGNGEKMNKLFCHSYSDQKTPLRLSIVMLAGVIVLSWINVSPAATFKDALGRTVTIKTTPKKIVSLVPSLTEILYYLGLGDRVAGVTQFSYYPPEAARKPNVGSYINLNVERIISLSPDLAIGTKDGNKPAVVKLLEKAGIPVYIVDPRRIEDVISTISALGELCGVGKRAKELSSRLDMRVNHIFSRTMTIRKPLVFLQINMKPIMTVNRNTFHHDVIRLAGGENMAQDEPITYPRISIEEVIRRRPEVIIISSMERGGRFEEGRKEWMKWSSIPAVKDRRIHLINSDLLDRPSPRIVKGLETMVRLIHPELEWDR
jgi:iron complex transport system substrate-binding protein